MQLQVVSAITLLALNGVADAWAPSNSYVPSNVTCANDINLLRNASGLSQDEQDWLDKRNPIAQEALKSFMERATANFSSNSSASAIIDRLFGSNSSNVPKIAIAASGGGYRAMLSGAGMVSAMDNRTEGANEHGLGGLLQAATYLAGLSGGNWLTTTLAWNNWTSVENIVDGMDSDDAIWDLSHSIVSPGGINIFKTGSRWDHIADAVEAKQDAGFNVSLADVWGRALSYQMFPSLYRGGLGYLWSDLREADVFKNGEMPMPISVADGRYPGTQIVDLNSTVFEYTPFELGSWDPSLSAFTDVRYLGTNVSNGKPVTEGQCVAGFDQVGFLMGTSSTLFNQFLLRINDTSLPKFIRRLATHFLKDLSQDYDDIAIYSPNPFKGADYVSNNRSQSLVNSDYLFLVDGGEDGENIPLVPLLQQERELDVIFALDNSADTNENWPAGISLMHTYRRQFAFQGQGVTFPSVPGVDTFMNLGLNQKPTFFGCDANNMTDLEYIPPLIVYIPNSHHSYNGNTSTFKLSYSEKERLGVIRNGFESATVGNLTGDDGFVGCIGCAILRRKQQALNMTLPAECEQCFTNYCWNGTVDATPAKGVSDSDDFSQASGSAAADMAEEDAVSSSSSSTATSTKSSTKKNSGVAVQASTGKLAVAAFVVAAVAQLV
ncbi:Lysophospholipase 1 [Nakaseomyces bracarensis]|uniref:Lysophospholipase n=1 Tax=Nakaseomyces bracarensis TaxID=273131 RepID=A0ABR4NQD2_9SACH